jgi:FkbM family methyltransferase
MKTLNKIVNQLIYNCQDALPDPPLTLVDVGASNGIPPEWDAIRQHLKVVGFEPDRDAYNELLDNSDDGDSVYLEAGLSNETSDVQLHITRSKTSSSILTPNMNFLSRFSDSERFDVVDTIPLKVDTLDHQLRIADVDAVDFVKIDTQGSEKSILEGATETINSGVCGLKLEVEFASMYENQPLFADIDVIVRQHGFLLFDLAPVYWKRKAGRRLGKQRGQIIWADALYLRDPDALISSAGDRIEDHMPSKLLKLAIVSVVYGYLDYARELILRPDFVSEIGEDKVDCIKKILDRGSAMFMKTPAFKGKHRLARAMLKLSQLFNTGRPGVYRDAREVGNR